MRRGTRNCFSQIHEKPCRGSLRSVFRNYTHGVLHPAIVRIFVRIGFNPLPERLNRFWNFPFPMLDVAVGKGEVRALAVTVGGHVPPLVVKWWLGKTELCVV